MGKILLEIKNIRKQFDGVEVLEGINLSIEEGEFITFLGSSGCGKTTTLRIIAGLETPDEGQVILEGKDVTRLDPNKRDVNTVFQNYALFPHMTVADNVGYGLKIKRFQRTRSRRESARCSNWFSWRDLRRESHLSFPEDRSREWPSPGL